MSEGTRNLEGMRNAFRRLAKRLFHRSDKRLSNHSTSDQPLNNASNPPQDTSTLSSGTNAKEQHQAPSWPLTTNPNKPSSIRDAQTTSRGSQVTGTSVSNNQPQSLKRKPQSKQEGYLKPALKKKPAKETPSQGSIHNHPSESPRRNLPLGGSSNRDEEKRQSRDEHADGPITTGSAINNDGVGRPGHHDVFVDHSVHPRPAAVHEEIEPHVHTIYEPTRTRSFHLHEHQTLIQPIVDPAAR